MRSIKVLHGTGYVWAGFCSILLSGCATSGAGPAGASLASAESCKSIKSELSKLDAKGVPAYVEAQSRGKKLSAAHKAEADKYNSLLNEYLGARCHV